MIALIIQIVKIIWKCYSTQGRQNVFEHGEDIYFQNRPSSPCDPNLLLRYELWYSM